MSGDTHVDVLIVGAGAAGSLFAAKLAQAGKSVLVLEPGPPWKTDDLISSQIWARRLRWGGPPVGSSGDNPLGVTFNTGWGLGGAALHHYGTWPRLMPSDFKMRSEHGQGLDWPIDYDDLRPFYDRIQEEVGISGDAEQEIWRPKGAPYPLPPLEQFAQAKLLRKGFEALGMKTSPSPMAILSRPYKGREACVYDGWCDAGCPIGALANPLVTYQPLARKAGARFETGAYVTRLIQGRTSRQVAGAEYVDGQGQVQRIAATITVLTASTLGNPTILLNSRTDGWNAGAANSSGLVGRYVMGHSIAPIYGFFDSEDTQNYLGVSGAQATNQDHYGKTSLGGGAFGSLQWQIAPTTKPNDLLGVAMSRADLFGDDLTKFMDRAVRHMALMYGFGEGLPMMENRVELTARSGPGGTKLPELIHGFATPSKLLWEQAGKLGLKIMKAAGAADPWNGPFASAHLMGGTVMGSDARTSVTDSYGRTHDIDNLFLAGPGLFPTGGAMNPNFTNHALSLRSAEHIIESWPS